MYMYPLDEFHIALYYTKVPTRKTNFREPRVKIELAAPATGSNLLTKGYKIFWPVKGSVLQLWCIDINFFQGDLEDGWLIFRWPRTPGPAMVATLRIPMGTRCLVSGGSSL